MRKEEKLEKELIGLPRGRDNRKTGLTLQGFLVEKRTERFKSGKPDLRISRKDLGQLDVELKYNDWPKESIWAVREVDTGMTKLQWLTLREYNKHGRPAVCLVYFEAFGTFLITTDQVLRQPLRTPCRYVLPKLPAPQVMDGDDLFNLAMEYLNGRY